VLSLVGDKWSVLIVVILQGGTRRFNELRHSIEGISQRMLTRTLRQLERDGLITRTVEPTVPPSVYYALTPLGQTLLVPVTALATWAQVHYPEICAAREVFDVKNGGKAA
jgi:DNA-binding HxlR family transcriptional regulator